MKPNHKRLVLEIPANIYEELEKLTVTEGKFKGRIISELVHKRFTNSLRIRVPQPGDTDAT